MFGSKDGGRINRVIVRQGSTVQIDGCHPIFGTFVVQASDWAR